MACDLNQSLSEPVNFSKRTVTHQKDTSSKHPKASIHQVKGSFRQTMTHQNNAKSNHKHVIAKDAANVSLPSLCYCQRTPEPSGFPLEVPGRRRPVGQQRGAGSRRRPAVCQHAYRGIFIFSNSLKKRWIPWRITAAPAMTPEPAPQISRHRTAAGQSHRGFGSPPSIYKPTVSKCVRRP